MAFSKSVPLDTPCGCVFVEVGMPLDASACQIHENRPYSCDMVGCTCLDYRPNKKKERPNHWPLCVCGHIAQDHTDDRSLSTYDPKYDGPNGP